MRTRALVVAAVLVSGCGTEGTGDPFARIEGPYRYDFNCMHITSAVDLPREGILHNMSLAERILEDSGAIPRGAYCETLGDVPIYVHPDRELWPGIGGWTPVNEVHLTSEASGLLHELLHVVDFRALREWTVGHVGWDQPRADGASFWDLTQEYDDQDTCLEDGAQPPASRLRATDESFDAASPAASLAR